jgi:hypothetical protein
MVTAMQQHKRRTKDVTRIMVSGYDVELVDEDRMGEFIVKFKGPEDSLYAGVSLAKRVKFCRENGG